MKVEKNWNKLVSWFPGPSGGSDTLDLTLAVVKAIVAAQVPTFAVATATAIGIAKTDKLCKYKCRQKELLFNL